MEQDENMRRDTVVLQFLSGVVESFALIDRREEEEEKKEREKKEKEEKRRKKRGEKAKDDDEKEEKVEKDEDPLIVLMKEEMRIKKEMNRLLSGETGGEENTDNKDTLIEEVAPYLSSRVRRMVTSAVHRCCYLERTKRLTRRRVGSGGSSGSSGGRGGRGVDSPPASLLEISLATFSSLRPGDHLHSNVSLHVVGALMQLVSSDASVTRAMSDNLDLHFHQE